MNRFDKRRAPIPFKLIDEPLPVDKFNFTKVRPMEKLFDVKFREIEHCVS